MNALILNGGGHEKPHGEIAGRAAAWVRCQGGSPAEFDLTPLDIAPCRGCFECWIKTPGACVTRDAMDGILKELSKAELVVWITPITYGGYGYHLKKVLDRSIPVLLPFFTKIGGESHHPLRYDLKRRLAVIGTLPAPDPESERIFHHLAGRNAINMHALLASFVLHGNAGQERWEDRLEALRVKKEN